ncbi:MAG: starch-binding protein [Ruminococcus sp.]|nr:starch-binding protein [Ruminococcus sp.]
MKKRTIRLCSVLLSMLTITSMPTMLSAGATEVKNSEIFTVTEDENGIRFDGPTGDSSLEYDETDDAEIIETVEDYYNMNSSGSVINRKNILLKSSASLPESVDNSESEYFPEIDSQGGAGSCVCWAQTYYQFTYTMNKKLGVTTTSENSFSPKWTYNLLNSGSPEEGTTYEDVNRVMKEFGNVKMSVLPYDDNFTSWSPYEEIWYGAMRYRVKDYQTLIDIGSPSSQITSTDDDDLKIIKTSLSNGDVLTFSTYISSWNVSNLKTNSNAPENNSYANEYVVTSQGGSVGGHRMTIVGYNDNIWTDINNNNTVDDGEMGALKIANSWGKGYCNDGFIWIAYDALNEVSCVEGAEEVSSRKNPVRHVSRIDVEEYNANTDLYLKYTLNSSYRGSVKPYLIAEKDGTEYSVNTFAKITFPAIGGDMFSFDGTTESNDGTFIYPLNSLISDISSDNFSDYSWSVKFVDKQADGKALTVKDAKIIDESTNTIYEPTDAYPITLDGDESTVVLSETNTNHAVVYYRGYENAEINYKIGNGSWQSATMEENTEREGYVHKFVADLGDTDSVKFYFSDNNGNVDDNNGNYYTAKRGLNYYVTENVREPLTTEVKLIDNNSHDVNSAHRIEVKANGGFEPYKYQFITEDLTTGAVSTNLYDSYSVTNYWPRSEGYHRITVNVMDYSGEVATDTIEFYVENKPFAYDSFGVTSSDKILEGQKVSFSAKTMYEGLQYIGYYSNTYDISIEKDGKTYYSNTVLANENNMLDRCSVINFSWTPTESGVYTAKISSTDSGNEYAQAEVNFEVAEFNGTIIGDTDNNGFVTIADATLIQKYCTEQVGISDIWASLADSDQNEAVNVKDATYIQLYLALGKSNVYVGNVNYKEPEPTTEPTTVQPTTVQPTTVAEKNTVVFTNSLNWSGTISCYYWSDTNTSMTSWPGKAMSYTKTNSYGQKQYTLDVPDDATYVIFTNGSSQTVDISYSGGEMRYYALNSTDSKGHYNVATW